MTYQHPDKINIQRKLLSIHKISKEIPIQAQRYQEIEATRFHDNRYTNVVKLSALRNGSIYPPVDTPVTQFRYRLRRPQGHCVAGRIMSKKISNVIIGNRTRDVPSCGAVLQPTAAPRARYYQ
jgi:hypothetical protein